MNKQIFFIAKVGWYMTEIVVTFIGCITINVPIIFLKFLFRSEPDPDPETE